MRRIFSLMILGVIPQNFDPNNLVLPIQKIEESNRTQHAREMLGKDYKKSSAQKAESVEKMEYALAGYVHNNLPELYKNNTSVITHAIIEEAQKYKLDPIFVTAIIETESRFQPRARGFHGEIGLMQIKPSIAQWVAKKYGIPWTGKHNLENPAYNIKVGTAYFSYLKSKFKQVPHRYIAAYNVGETRARRMFSEAFQDNYLFAYTKRIKSSYNRIYDHLVISQIPYLHSKKSSGRSASRSFEFSTQI